MENPLMISWGFLIAITQFKLCSFFTVDTSDLAFCCLTDETIHAPSFYCSLLFPFHISAAVRDPRIACGFL